MMTKFFKYLIILFLPCFVCASSEKIKITTSNYQLASLTKMITADMADIEIIASYKICPEHYSMKPGDIAKIKNRELLIYIDKKFELFMNNVLGMHEGRVLQISSIDALNLDDGNYHIWMDLYNVRMILKHIHQSLVEMRPKLRQQLDMRLAKAMSSIEELQRYKASSFAGLKSPMMLHNSVYYLFDPKVSEKKYVGNYNVTMRNIDEFLDLPQDKCLISNKNESFYMLEEKIRRKIVKIDCEAWQFDVTFIEQYKNIIDIVSQQCR